MGNFSLYTVEDRLCYSNVLRFSIKHTRGDEMVITFLRAKDLRELGFAVAGPASPSSSASLLL